MKKVIVHPGRSHRDDFLSVCVLLAESENLVVERREPTSRDLEDPRVFVVDVGFEYDPSRGNFDHHQDLGLPCGFHLVMKHLGYHDLAKNTFGWYDITSRIDVNGPYQVASEEGVSTELLLSMNSPIEFYVLGEFGRCTSLDSASPLYVLMREIGIGILSALTKIQERLELLKTSARVVDLGVIRAIVHEIEDDPSRAMDMFRKSLADPLIAVSVSPSDRGEGWAFYRFENNPKVDFTLISGCDPVSFAHRGGFLAKTSAKIPIDEALCLVERSILA